MLDFLFGHKKTTTTRTITRTTSEKMYSREEVLDMLFDISTELQWDDKDEFESIAACQSKIIEIKNKL